MSEKKKMAVRIALPEALDHLKCAGNVEFVELFRNDALSVEVYKPHEVDRQLPHSRDELYVVVAGSGEFWNGEVRHSFQAGDVMYVPAGVSHRFESFTDDFATWVIFFGK